MIFLLDECFPAHFWKPISRFFSAKHTFLRVVDDFDKGTKDTSLFRLAADLGADVIITNDIKQIEGLDCQHERSACRESNLHWVGVPRSPKARGKNIWQGQLAQLLGAMQFIVATIDAATEPQAILLTDGGHSTPCQNGYPQAL